MSDDLKRYYADRGVELPSNADMPKGAEKMTKNLDMLVELDEPESFVHEAIRVIEVSSDDRWKPVLEALRKIDAKLAASNEPASQKSATDEASPTE
jgi:hypothetical protein